MLIHRIVLTGALCAAGSLSAGAATLAIDPAHTQAEFTVTHLALSKVHGQIPLVSGSMTTGANDLPTAATATFDIKSLDSHDPNRDKSLKSNEFFDADAYPTMTFVATKVDGTPAQFTMTGNLTLHGVTKPVTLTCKIEGTLLDRGKRHVAYTATTKIDRREWGMDSLKSIPGGQLFAGNDVDIALEVDAVEK